ncbi:MAG: DUF1049 domain-containing protein [Nocardia sp.]|nr:DUF1049 domain-containing protein [Nocardia sp.]
MTSDPTPEKNQDPVSDAGTPRVQTPGSPATGHLPKNTRVAYTWAALIAAAVIGLILLIFILQNLDQVRIHLFFWQLDLPLGVTMLLSVIGGALVMALVGGWRILQLRRAAHKVARHL